VRDNRPTLCLGATPFPVSALTDRDFLFGLDGRGMLGHRDTKHPLIEIGLDLILINGIGELERSLACTVAAFYEMVGVLFLVALGLLLALQRMPLRTMTLTSFSFIPGSSTSKAISLSFS
jgi:hypothetical protein